MRFFESRGAILVENAIIIPFALALMFTGFQVGLIIYTQLQLDYAAQTQAQYLSWTGNFGSSEGLAIQTILQSDITRLKKDNFIKQTVQDPPDINYYGLDFNYADNNARSGGETLLTQIPVFTQVMSDTSNLILGLFKVNSLSGVGFTSTTREVCPLYCLDPAASIPTTAAAALGYPASHRPFAFVLGTFVSTCGTNTNQDFTQVNTWDTCPGVINRDEALAELIENENASYLLPGETLDPSYIGNLSSPPAPNQAGMFYEIWCHCNIYAWIQNNALQLYPSLPALTQTSNFLSLWLGYQPDGTPKPGQVMYSSLTPIGDPVSSAGWDRLLSLPGDEEPGAETVDGWYGCGVPLP